MKKILGLVIIIVTGVLIGLFVIKNKEQLHPSSTGNMSVSKATSTTQSLTLPNGKIVNFTIHGDYTISIAASGMQRVRFMALSPDNRLFVTDMKDQSDNSQGRIYVLTNYNSATKQFEQRTTYLENLRNPNSIAFYTDQQGKEWLYIALTDKLIRYPYKAGDMSPASGTPPQVLASFPDYGLPATQGGWHLTRTIEIHNDTVYVSVGSSCNSCEEKEEFRASIVAMDPDGSRQRLYAKGLRNAVGIQWAGDALYATDMGVDHLGTTKPDDMFYKIKDGTDYGWPYCYVSDRKVYTDSTIQWNKKTIDCNQVVAPEVDFPAHSAPLGFAYIDSSFSDSYLRNSFLVALHGSGKPAIGTGYSIVKIDKDTNQISDFITGFYQNGIRLSRAVDVLKYTDSSFLISDDLNGLMYLVQKN